MAISAFVLGNTGMGKSYSLRNLDPKRTLVIQAIKQPLPFKGSRENFKVWDKDKQEGQVIHTDNTKSMINIITKAKEKGKDIIVIDDFQYIMSNDYMRNWEEKGYEKYSRLGHSVWDLIMKVNNDVDDDTRVYFLGHTEENDLGEVKIKTIGKLLDDKVVLEGLTTIVLRAIMMDRKYKFSTQNNGKDTCKSPYGMFDEEFIDNDLNMVDDKICEYYGIKK